MEEDEAPPEAQTATDGRFTWTLSVVDETQTASLARHVSMFLAAGDLVTLSGGLGVGKTTFARALIRAMLGDPSAEVPSPTFTLVQVYQGARCPLVHADLFRLQDRSELDALGWEEMSESAIVLVEWPERAGIDAAPDRLDVAICLDPAGSQEERTVELTGFGHWQRRLRLAKATFDLIAVAGWGEATREFIQGDASTRAYERLRGPGGTAILMISPPRPDGPPIKEGRPYSEIAKLAERAEAFVAMAQALRRLGYSTPEILANDLEAGVLLIEDLGTEGVVDAKGPMPERYALAVDLLADLHRRNLPEVLPIEIGQKHQIPRYDLEALQIEVDLLLDWYVPHVLRAGVPASGRVEFVKLWRALLDPIVTGARTWTLRDYHSPNLLWLPERAGLSRLGLLDIQDAVIGHPAYDLASLLQDARADVPPELEIKLLAAYAHARQRADPYFDMTSFAAAYATLGAQRATKVLGIFARLDRRDGKSQYLAHIPRLKNYLVRNLSHPVLRDLRLWYENNLPGAFGNLL